MEVETIDDLEKRMKKVLQSLASDFAGLRTGRASTNMLDTIMVEAYQSLMPLAQVASVSVPESRLLMVTVWDNELVKAVEKAIRDSALGLNPQTEGNSIRLPIPELNEERRREIARVASKVAEQARIAIRGARRDGIDSLRKAEKESSITQDDLHRASEKIQTLTDHMINEVDTALQNKEAEILKI